MEGQHDFEELARGIVDANLYLVLGTADEAGRPWVSPVYFAHAEYREFLWVSRPGTKHSRNIAGRPEVSIVVFDSQVPISTGRAVYVSAVAEQIAEEEVERGIEIFSSRSLEHGGVAWTSADVLQPDGLRLYRANALEVSVLVPGEDRRVTVVP